VTDDELFSALAEANRERDPLADPRWDALARGALSPADRAALEALAGSSGAGRAAMEAFAPLDERERTQLVAKILAARGASPGEPAQAPAPPQAVARVIPFPARRRALLFSAATLAAVAASAALFFRSPGGSAIPTYQASIAGEQAQRSPFGDPDAARRLGPGSAIDLVLRPATPVSGPLAARGFVLQGGRVRAWDAPVVISEEGAVRIAGSYDALLGGIPSGPCELVFAVGRPGELPSSPEAIGAALRDPAPRGFQLLRVPVVLVERP
jgi:hypothetical protein